MTEIIDRIREQFDRHGHLTYGETVDLREHMLQTAYFAERQDADPELVTAALLHDYGHLISGLPEDTADRGSDGRHEELGAKALEGCFPPRVIAAIRLHVAAKRYLCGKRPEYFKRLSPASVDSLMLQGGAMSAGEITRFETSPWYQDAVAVRVFDDLGKAPDLSHPDLDHYLEIVRGCVLSAQSGSVL